jgi:hypothetical protein
VLADTLFALVVLPELRRDQTAIWLRIHGTVDPRQFRDVLLGLAKQPTPAANASIAEIGFVEAWLLSGRRAKPVADGLESHRE